MFENGILKQNELGQYEAVLDPAESEYIKSEISKTKRKNCMSGAEAEEIQKQLEKLEGVDEEEGMEWCARFAQWGPNRRDLWYTSSVLEGCKLVQAVSGRLDSR